MKKDPKVAIVCDWLTNLGGAERVVLDMHEAFPNAPIYTSIYNEKELPQFAQADLRTSFLQKFPFAKKKHQIYLPLMPYAFESFDLSEYDIILSSAFAAAKGVITKPETLHICYCHNPMRYVWDQSHQYIREHTFPGIIKWLAKPFLHKIRMWDKLAADRVDNYIANSEYVAKRIKKYYDRESTVINPGVRLTPSGKIRKKREDYYLAAGRLKSYKKFDLIIKSFNKLKKKLYVIGTGEELEKLKKLNTNSKTKFLGFVPEQVLMEYYSKSKALIFPQVEDFGITPIEAQSFGCPVIAYKEGGALETIKENKTGIFFAEQTVESLSEAIKKFEKKKWNYEEIAKHAEKFDSKKFQDKLKKYVTKTYDSYRS